MDSSRWDKIQEIFEKVADLSLDERDKLLNELCGADLELKEEVLSLLVSDQDDYSILEKPAVNLFEFDEEGSSLGKAVGKYKLLKVIGYGGMGEVYLAERTDDQFHQKVAIKIIKKGMVNKETVRRFNSERQILAKLVHPNIARLYDGGLTEDGRPYFTMEYIEGQPINKYCDEKKLSINERLNLFIDVLKAVSYAQKNLIVHRDLKPGNIIVTESGDVKLLDFGIAKLVIDENDKFANIDQTQTEYRMMTPGYASPEQIKGEMITTASDVYSLGVILFELLTGHRPYKVSGLTPGEYENVICNTEPSRPSAAVTKEDDTFVGEITERSIEAVAELRSTNPDKLKKVLNGDLDNLCLKALEKDQERRYNSAEQLAEDLVRYLNGHPVLARPATINYRFKKFISRNRSYVIASTAVLVLIVSLVSFYTIQLSNERDKAKLEAEKAKRITEYIISIFQVANPSENQGETITARELVEQGAERIEDELKDQPEVQAEIMWVISDVYYSLGMLEKARDVIEKTVDKQISNYGRNSIQVGQSYHNLGDINYELGNYQLADSFYNIALDIKEEVLEPNDTLIALELISLGTVARLNSDFEKSRDFYERALEIQLASLEKPHPDIAYTMNNLGRLYQQNDMYDKAEPLLTEGLQMRADLFGDYNVETIASTGSLASLYILMGRYDESAELYGKAEASLEHMVGEDHYYTGAIKSSYGKVETYRKEYKHAEKLFRDAMRILSKNLPPGHIGSAQSYLGIGRLFIEMNQLDSAIHYIDTGMTIQRLSLPENNFKLAVNKAYLGRAFYLKHDFDPARENLEEAYAVLKDSYGDNNYNTQKTISFMIDLYKTVHDSLKVEEFSKKVQ